MIWRLIRNTSKKYYGRATIIVGVLCISMVAMILLWWMYDNIQKFLFQQSGLYEYSYTLEIKDAGSRGGVVRNELSDRSIFDSVLADETLARKYVVSHVNMPAQAQLKFGGQQVGSDILIFAISDNFFDGSVNGPVFPMAVSESMLNLYNTQIADETTLPKISTSILKILRIQIMFGTSGIFNIQGPFVSKTAKITKISGMLPLGFIIPESIAKSVMQQLNQGSIYPYKVIVIVDDPQDIPIVTEKYSKDFVVKSTYDKINQIQKRIKGVKYFFMIINASIMLVLVSFLIYITFSIVEQNQRSFRVYRLHGATPKTILTMLLGQSSLYVLIASIITCGGLMLVLRYIVPVINTIVADNYGIGFAIQYPYLRTYLYTFLAHGILFGLLVTVFAFPEWSKKFENK